MTIGMAKPLFAWDALADLPSQHCIRTVLEAIPDHDLLDALSRARGKGRDDYPVSVLWGTLLLAIVLRHHTMDACLEELRRNPALRLLIGIESEAVVPKSYILSRLLATLGEAAFLP